MLTSNSAVLEPPHGFEPQTPPPAVRPLREADLREKIIAHARTGIITLRADQTIGEAMASLRSEELSDEIVYFYVVDSGRKLVGVVPTRRLLMSRSYERISDIMITRLVTVSGEMTVREVCQVFVGHRLLALPVVDEQQRLVGVVDVGLFTNQLAGVSERRSADNLFQLIGIHVTNGRANSPVAGFKDRFPWLMCNIAGGLACAFLSSQYEKLLDQAIVLALFIPIVLTLAESVSIQSMTITLQGLDRARIDWRMIFRCLGTEFFTALLLGGASGLLVAVVSLIWKRQPIVSLAIGGSICCAIVTACLLGVLLPTIVRLFRRDPKIAAGPVVLATADVATLLFFFNISRLILH